MNQRKASQSQMPAKSCASEQGGFVAPGLYFWLCHLLAVCLWGIQQTSLSSALVFRTVIINTHRAGLGVK